MLKNYEDTDFSRVNAVIPGETLWLKSTEARRKRDETVEATVQIIIKNKKI